MAGLVSLALAKEKTMKKYVLMLAVALLICAGTIAPASAQFYPYGGGPFGAALSLGFGGPAPYYGGYGYGYPRGYGYGYGYPHYGYRQMSWGPRYDYGYETCDLVRERRIVRHGRVIVRRYCVR
jgi:hypothetical protein